MAVRWLIVTGMVAGQVSVVGRRSARAILLDEHGRLVLIKRTRPGVAPYWTTPGGGVEDADDSVEAALRRELAEELGAEVSVVSQVFLVSSLSASGVAVQHFFAARLERLDQSTRDGPEFDDPARGGYEVECVDLLGDRLETVNVKPVALKEFIVANREALLTEVGLSIRG